MNSKAKLITIIILMLSILTAYGQPKLVYHGNNTKYKLVVAEANKILQNREFYNAISFVKKFDNTKYTGYDISELIKNSNLIIEIKLVFMPIANASTESSTLIYISRIHLSSDIQTSVNTLIHEVVHAVDLGNNGYNFTHSKNNNADGKQDGTAPWVIAKIAEHYRYIH